MVSSFILQIMQLSVSVDEQYGRLSAGCGPGSGIAGWRDATVLSFSGYC